MGWTPTRKGGDQQPEQAPVPARRRRRKTAAEKEAEAFPNVTAAQAASPRISTGERPSPGVAGAEGRTSIKVALGDRWSRIIMDIRAEKYSWREFCDGLDEEELARGQLRAEDGTFTGRPPSFVPREFLLACQREQKRRFEELFGSEVLGLTKDFLALCKDKEIPAKDRAKLLQYAMERVFGGIPKDVRVSQEQPWESMVVNVVSDGQEGMPGHLQRRYAGYAERQGGAAEGEGT